MANEKLTDLTELTAVQDGDFLYIVDVSDTTDSPDGTGKKITKFNLSLDTADFLGSIVPTDTPTGTGASYWLATQAGTYTNFGGVAVSANSIAVISRNSANSFSISQTPLDLTNYLQKTDNIKIAPWTAKAYASGDQVNYLGKDWVSNEATVADDAPGTSSKWVERLGGYTEDLERKINNNTNNTNLHEFKDLDGKLIAFIDKEGNFWFYVTEEQKEKLQPIRTDGLFITDDENYIFKIISQDNKLVFAIDKFGKASSETEIFDFVNFPLNFLNNSILNYSIETLNESVTLNSTAKGRASTEIADDAPTIPLTNSGYTHPSLVHVPSKWNGFEFWLAITPYFGIINAQPQPSDFENPHIFCGNWNAEKTDIVFQEPVGITNPIDIPPSLDISSGYWSDTHLMLGDDGYMYCFYRGNWMPDSYLNTTETSNARAIVYKKSKNGINWSDRTFVYSTTTSSDGIDVGMMSPAVVQNGTIFHKFELVDGNKAGLILTGQNQTQRVVVHTLSKSIESNYSDITQESVVNFKNRPWGVTKDVWHLDAQKFGNTYFLLLDIGIIGVTAASDLYLAYSGDGWNFTVIETPIAVGGRYRSSITSFYDDKKIGFFLLESLTADGSLKLKKITLKNI